MVSMSLFSYRIIVQFSNNEKILYVGYRDNSHSSAGGYDSIIGNPEADCLMGENVPLGSFLLAQEERYLM